MGAGHMVVLSPDGELLSEFGRTGYQDGSFSFPDHLTFDSKDLWAIADRENNRVVIFRLHTPYPPPNEIEASKYEGMVSIIENTWSTPKKDRPPSASPTPGG
jgi:hypothetical protein